MRFLKLLKLTAVIFIIIFTMLNTIVSIANTEQENIDLARISNILNAVYPLIKDAKKQAVTHSRVMFRYDWLTTDIQSIQAGIAQKINRTDIEPRVIVPLKTQYIEQLNSHKK